MIRRKKGFVIRNLANLLTLIRLLLTLVILCCMQSLYKNDFDDSIFRYYVVLTCFVWASDFFDGKIARKLNIESRFGSLSDVTVDFIYVISLHIQLTAYGMIPPVFLCVILERLLNFIITSVSISRMEHRSFNFVRDRVGRYVAASFFAIPIITCSLEKYTSVRNEIIDMVVLVELICSIYSSTSRIVKKKSIK